MGTANEPTGSTTDRASGALKYAQTTCPACSGKGKLKEHWHYRLLANCLLMLIAVATILAITRQDLLGLAMVVVYVCFGISLLKKRNVGITCGGCHGTGTVRVVVTVARKALDQIT